MSLVLYNPLQGTKAELPELPQYWVQVHESATAASMVSGAFTYAFSHMLGSAATRLASGSISITGLIMASGVRYVSGDETAEKIYRSAKTVANLVDTTGIKATEIVSAVSSTATAATVGSTFMIGKMIQQLYRGFTQKEDGENILKEIKPEKEACAEGTVAAGSDFIIYDITPTTSNSSASSLYPTLSEQTETPPPAQQPIPTNETSAPSSVAKPATPVPSNKRKQGSS